MLRSRGAAPAYDLRTHLLPIPGELGQPRRAVARSQVVTLMGAPPYRGHGIIPDVGVSAYGTIEGLTKRGKAYGNTFRAAAHQQYAVDLMPL